MEPTGASNRHVTRSLQILLGDPDPARRAAIERCATDLTEAATLISAQGFTHPLSRGH